MVESKEENGNICSAEELSATIQNILTEGLK